MKMIRVNGARLKRPQKRKPRPIPAGYVRRNAHLQIIGFESYSHYLRSEMWATIRQMILDRDGGKCIICGATAANVHHNDYEIETLIGKRLMGLVSLCRRHHEDAEFDAAGKTTLRRARGRLIAKGMTNPVPRTPPLHKTLEALPKAVIRQANQIMTTMQEGAAQSRASIYGNHEERRAIRRWLGQHRKYNVTPDDVARWRSSQQ